MSDVGLRELKKLNKLTALHLRSTEITDIGLTEIKELDKLTTLTISSLNVTDVGLRELASLEGANFFKPFGYQGNGMLVSRSCRNMSSRMQDL